MTDHHDRTDALPLWCVLALAIVAVLIAILGDALHGAIMLFFIAEHFSGNANGRLFV